MKLMTRHDDHSAVQIGSWTQSYAELQSAVNDKMELLQSLDSKTGKVALDLPDSGTFLEWALAAWGSELCIMILDQRLTEAEKQARLLQYRPDIIICSDAGAGIAPAFQLDVPFQVRPCSYEEEAPISNTAQEVEHNHAALVLFSSGSTGIPKLIKRDSAALLAEWSSYSEEDGSPDEHARVLCLVPVSHTFGLVSAVVHTLRRGGTIVFPEMIKPRAIVDIIAEQSITHMYGVAFHYQLLLTELEQRRHALPCKLPLMLCSGGPLPAQLLQQYQDKLHVGIGQQYGMSEVGYIAVDFRALQPGSVGSIASHLSWMIDEEQQLGIQLPCSPYVTQQENWIPHDKASSSAAQPAEGILLTQDVVEMNDSCWLTITGRANDLVSIGGLKVKITEVEHTLRGHPDIHDCCVVALPHPIYGHILEAFIVWGPEQWQSFEQLTHWLKQHLADYKIPRKFRVVEHIPTSAAGKILKGQLMKEIAYERSG
ncbi:long-chain fatty acid--CoA ligase [Paenibacillus sp. ACRRX]|uniref:class I adenylate-forming enzyme family protein n=1 Tax=Paenibacillus sp. ACRRX TaxID=2918206 RepID=UPI001EF5E841|nr:long-chain fatty acid--CoA ligase [Paenibacillus sp. ACRRX]MCG7408931.1 long-chain fatty acid--CoA ligase [Paenibacillus sp. ACRRX]